MLIEPYIYVSSTKSAEGAIPNRAVRKGCYYGDIFLVSAVGATPNKYNRCRSFRPHTLIMSIYPGLAPFAIRCRSFRASSITCFTTIYELIKFVEICRRPTDRREVTHVILVSLYHWSVK